MQENKKEIIEIPVEDIVPNRFQPRLTFDMEALNELANSIREHGIIQPLVVRKLQDKYEIIAGERRFKAASLINMQKVPCIVMDLTDNESAEVAVIENIQRKEMSPLEEAKSFKKILDKGYLTQDELAKRMGKSQSSIANKLRLLNLDDVVQEAILNNKISERHARSLLKIENKIDQRNVLNEIIEKRLTVRQTDELIKEKFGSDKVNNEENNENINNRNLNINNIESSIFKDPVKVEEPKVEVNPYAGYKSTPEINLPTNNTIESNPQLNIMDNNPNENTIVNMYKYNENQNNTNTNINNMTASSNDIQSVINPSVFSQSSSNENNIMNNENNNVVVPTNGYEIVNPNISNDIQSNTNVEFGGNNGLTVDINSIKNNAQDIIKKEDNSAEIANLMASDKPENKFFVDLNAPLDKLEPLPFRVQSALDSINRRLDEIKSQGTMLRKEERDLGSSYQVIITIDK